MTKNEQIFDWNIEIEKAQNIGLITKACVAPISCVRHGPNLIAFVSAKTETVIHTSISAPNPQQIKLELDDNIIGMEWQKQEPHNLLIILEKNLVIIDHQNNAIIHQVSATDSSILFIDAHFIPNGQVVALSQKNALTLYDSNLENSNQMSSLNNGKTFCCAMDGNRIFIGQHRDVLIFEFHDNTMTQIGSFVAHPRDIKKIQVLNDHLLILTDEGSVLWDKKDLVPLASIKSRSTSFFADDYGELGIDIDTSSKQIIYKLTSGKKDDLTKLLPLKKFEIDSAVDADWIISEPNEKSLAISAKNSKDFCLVLIVKFTRCT